MGFFGGLIFGFVSMWLICRFVLPFIVHIMFGGMKKEDEK